MDLSLWLPLPYGNPPDDKKWREISWILGKSSNFRPFDWKSRGRGHDNLRSRWIYLPNGCLKAPGRQHAPPGGGKCSPRSEKSERKFYNWSSKLKIYRNLVPMISSRLPATFLSKPIFRPPQGVSPSQAANFLKIPYQNHNVEPEQIRILAYHGFKGTIAVQHPNSSETKYVIKSLLNCSTSSKWL